MSDTSFTVPRKPIAKLSVECALESETDHDAKQSLNPEEPVLLSKARRTTVKQSFISVWWLEVICCVLAIGMILSLVFTLLPFRHQKAIYDLPYHLSVNTLISIFMTVVKACGVMVLAQGLGQLKWVHFRRRQPIQHFDRYDAATRGPLGCIKLLVSLKDSGVLTTVGAVSSILFLAVDPFAQQLVQYYPCELAATNGSTGSIPRSKVYCEQNARHPTDAAELTIAQKSTFANGFFNPETVQVTVDCSSGNCIFPEPFTTIGFCSKCSDATNGLHHFWTNDTETNRTWYNSTLPSGLSTWTGPDYELQGVSSLTTNPDNVFSVGTHYDDLVLNIELIYDSSEYMASLFEDCHKSDNKTWGCLPQGAMRCTIQPCVKVLKANFINGVLTENEIASYTDWHGGSSAGGWAELSMADLSCVNDTAKKKLQSLGFNISDSRFIPYNVDTYWAENTTQIYGTDNNSTAQLALVPADCIYNMPVNTILGLQMFASEFLDGHLSTARSAAFVTGSSQCLRLLDVTDPSLESVSKPFVNIAQALTVKARQWQCALAIGTGNTSCNVPASGVLLLPSTCIRVRWPWMIYPASLVLMTLSFFVVLVVYTEITEKNGFTRGWKSSPLPLIYHGLDEILGSKSQSPAYSDDIKSMDRAAKADTAYVVPNDRT